VMIGYANLWMKQGRGEDYIPVSLTSSNSGWHKGCSTCGTTPSSHFRRSPETPSPDVEVLVGRPRKGGAVEDPQGSLGSGKAPSRSRGNLIESPRAVPCSRSCAAPEAVAPPLQDDGRSGPLGGDCDRSEPPAAV
jgi:hypothetical protein